MSVFEDLIDELKNENLLESTVIDVKEPVAQLEHVPTATAAVGALEQVPGVKEVIVPPTGSEASGGAERPLEDEFFLNRATEEVSSLQMVEHVLSGVERTVMETPPPGYDDLNVNKALHRFQQVAQGADSPEYIEAEFALRQETQAWAFALHERDQKLPLSKLRRYCEDSRPVLSSQALVALARFYRNSPFSEEVRAKFDFVMTRLFARESGEATRKPLFSGKETIGHINTLYGKWSSIALFTAAEHSQQVIAAIGKLDEFRAEMKATASFDDLLRSELLGRVRMFKEQLAEVFFVPEVAAASIACNLDIGNRFVQLVALEKANGNSKILEAKYGDAYDELVSDSVAKTLQLSELFAREFETEKTAGEESAAPSPAASPGPAPFEPKKAKPVEPAARPSFDISGVNRWLLAVCVASIFVGAGAYLWAEKFAAGGEIVESVSAPVQIGDVELKKYVRSPRATKDTMYAITEPAFESLDSDGKKVVLGKLQKFAGTMNYPKVNLINPEGRSVAFASKDRFELVDK